MVKENQLVVNLILVLIHQKVIMIHQVVIQQSIRNIVQEVVQL